MKNKLQKRVQNHQKQFVQKRLMVEVTGIEPATSCVQGRRSTN